MELLIELENKEQLEEYNADGFILPLENYSTESSIYYNVDEIITLSKKLKGKIFVKINKNLFNKDIKELSSILLRLDKCKIDGILFYDLAILKLKKDLNLSIDLVWNQTHMVNNYVTCNYYYEKGVNYAYLSNEITLDEVLEIKRKTPIKLLVDVVYKPSVAFSLKKLLTSYNKDKKELIIEERITNDNYKVIEDNNGTHFSLDRLVNATSLIKELYQNNIDYIVMKEEKINNFKELVLDTMNYIKNGCIDDEYVLKYQVLGDFTNFFYKKTIYQVKKDEKN